MEVFPPMVVGALKPSITFRSLHSLQLAPQFAPAHSPVCSSSLSSSLPPSPIAPYTPQVVGTPTHICPFGVRWSRLGVSWSKLGAGSELEQADFGPVVGTYKGLLRLCEWTLGGDFTSRWWGHISRICHNGSFSATGGGGSKA